MVNTRMSPKSEAVLPLVTIIQKFDFDCVERERVAHRQKSLKGKEPLKRNDGLKILKPQ